MEKKNNGHIWTAVSPSLSFFRELSFHRPSFLDAGSPSEERTLCFCGVTERGGGAQGERAVTVKKSRGFTRFLKGEIGLA